MRRKKKKVSRPQLNIPCPPELKEKIGRLAKSAPFKPPVAQYIRGVFEQMPEPQTAK